jgi:hypothetical protein
MRVTDYCATCGTALVELPSGSRIACCPREAQYWSPHEPLAADARGFGVLTGLYPRVQLSWSTAAGVVHTHPPLYLYRSVSGGMT